MEGYLEERYAKWDDNADKKLASYEKIKPCGPCCASYFKGVCCCLDTVTCEVCCRGEDVNGCLSCINGLICFIPRRILNIIPGCCIIWPCAFGISCYGACASGCKE